MVLADVRRVFLGWDRPLARVMADELIARRPDMDFSSLLLVTSGGRAGRRLVTLLAEAAAARKVAMIPPTILTPGILPERLVRPPLPPAGDMARRLAWISAMRGCERDTKQIFPRLRSSDDLAAWSSAARVLERCNEELAAGQHTFATAAQRLEDQPTSGDTSRWTAAARIHQAYLETISTMGFCDAQDARMSAIASSAIKAPGTIILAGVAELNAQTRRMLESIGASVEAWIHAPADLADLFDPLGCPQTSAWLESELDLDRADVRVVQTPTDQAEEIFVAIAAEPNPLRCDQITIGVTDETLVPYVESAAQRLADAPVRYGAGRPMLQTRPYQLLSAVAAYLESRTFSDYRQLLRHPDLEEWLRIRSADPQAVPWRDWQTLLDDYAAEHLPDQLTAAQATPDGWRGAEGGDPDAQQDRAALAWLYAQVVEFLSPLHAIADTPAPPRQWAAGILAVLAKAYGERTWNSTDESERRVIQSCLYLRDALDELRALPDSADPAAHMKASEAIGTVLSLVAGHRIPPPMTGCEIEMVGWLELPADDADRLIVTGFNDGLVPEAAGADPLLTNTLRRSLGLSCDEDRYSRDAYLLSAILASRPPNRVTLISGRRSADGDPLLPSRLLFACKCEAMARRIMTAVDDKPTLRPILVSRAVPSAQSQFFIGAKLPLPAAPALTSLPVTAFREYLRSPQGFYLKHILRLSTIEESSPCELDARQCGDLIHRTMKLFADGPARNSQSRDECTDSMLGAFDKLVTERFGGDLGGVLRFQVAMMKKRLEHLAAWQAEWAKQRWRIHKTEWQPNAITSIDVDRLPMGLRGRIDRIDIHETTGDCAILDYKVGSYKTPNMTHLRKGAWCDLQLPLYRYLVKELIPNGNIHLGYITVADTSDEIRDAMADWNQQMLQEADEAAREVIRAIRQGRFDEIGDQPPTDGIFAHIFGQQLMSEEAP